MKLLRSILAALSVAVCIPAVLAMSMPHHHHDGEEVLCFSLSDCCSHEHTGCSHGESHACGHDASEPRQDDCDLTHIVVSQPRHYTPVDVAPVLLAVFTMPDAEPVHTLRQVSIRPAEGPPLPLRITRFITRAHPLRAPSLS